MSSNHFLSHPYVDGHRQYHQSRERSAAMEPLSDLLVSVQHEDRVPMNGGDNVLHDVTPRSDAIGLNPGQQYNMLLRPTEFRNVSEGEQAENQGNKSLTKAVLRLSSGNDPTTNKSHLMRPEDSVLLSVLDDPQRGDAIDHDIEVYNGVAEAMEREVKGQELHQSNCTIDTNDETSYYHQQFHPSHHLQHNQRNFESHSQRENSYLSLKRPLDATTNLGMYLEGDDPPESFDNAGHPGSPKRQRIEYLDGSSLGYDGDLPNNEGTPFDFEASEIFRSGRRNSNSPASNASGGGTKKINNEQWDTMYERLKNFKQQQGHCLVPKRYNADPKLGTWVETQRVQHKRLARTYDPHTGMETVQPNNRLTAERLHKLQAIGFAWSAKHWRKLPSETVHKKTEDGHLMSVNDLGDTASAFETFAPADGEGNSQRSTIGTAIQATQHTKTGGHPPHLQQQQRRRQRLNDAQWEDMYQRLVQYKTEHGHCLVPRKYEKDQKLSTWVETQRVLWNRDYRQKDPKEAVEAAAATAAATTIALAGYNADNPNLPAPVYEVAPATTTTRGNTSTNTDAYVNGENVSDQMNTGVHFVPNSPVTAKVAADRGKRLTLERKKKLDELGFVWSLRSKRIEDHWDEMFQQLLQYKEEHGDCLVPSRYEANLKLGKWVETQRYEYTKRQRSNETSASASTGTVNNALPESAQLCTGLFGGNETRGSRQSNPRLTEERLRRLESIGFQWKVKHKMKRYYDKQWDSMFDRLKAFKEVNGHCIVPKRYPADARLGTWVHTQRIQYRKLTAGTKKETLTEEEVNMMNSCGEETAYRLTDERRARLESLGFVWNMKEGEKGTDTGRIARNSYDDQWDTMFDTLKEYKLKHGNCLVPKRFKENPKLGTWVDTQRVQYKKLQKKLADQGKPHDAGVAFDFEDTAASQDPAAGWEGDDSLNKKPLVGRLTEERIRRLEELGFIWSLRDDWQKHYDELKTFKSVHGHCNVPARYTANRRLGIWVSAQRQQYKTMNQMASVAARRAAPLTQDRIELLNQLGFSWTIRSRDSLGESWNQRLEELKKFKDRHGHCMVPSRYSESPELGIWVGTQRTQYRLYMKAKETGEVLPGAAAMNETRIRLLEELGFIWALRGTREDHMNLRQVHMQHPVSDRDPSTHTSAPSGDALRDFPSSIVRQL
ncbi:helicase domain protein [Nitzschia inconspicua]|uniref:Helicase domain protein n=1 Tax=Nitzschia inconspicua TaxID=303405 RepID=A0A9K3PR58_9STRA|nr:helicase domain protein [Nitzschia inconspicua]